MKWQEVVPVLLSVVVIVLVAVLEKQSKLVAAIMAVMPLGAPLALWIVYAANAGDRSTMTQFSWDLLIGLLPTLGFLVAVWLAARAGLKLIPMLAVGYAVWAAGVGLIALLRRSVGL